MGMYDTIINYYDVGPGFNRKKLQTKTIYDTPTMSVYWLDPAGQFWVLNCDGTHDFCEDHNDPLKFKWVKNGNHGKCSPFLYNGTITVYPEVWDCKYAPFPECRLTFRRGILEVVTNIIKNK